jgi:serine/threonine protein phosphatase PrpC
MIREDVGEQRDTDDYVALNRKSTQFWESEPRIRMQVEVAGKTHPGLVRPNNEDNYLAVRRYRGRVILVTSLPEGLLEPTEDHAYTLAVADGMGGHRFGELASLLAMRTGFELGGDEIKWTVRLNDHEIEELRQKAETFCRLLDEALHAEIRENPRLAGMGTTLTLCYTTGPNLFTIHAGDSRAYLFRDGILQQLTRDHNLGQMLVDSGLAEPNSPKVLRVRHVLTNCLGGPDSGVKADVDHYLLEDGDRVLLCTDGLNDMASDEEIAGALKRHPSPSDACEALIALALKGGGKDNVTVVVANYRVSSQ